VTPTWNDAAARYFCCELILMNTNRLWANQDFLTVMVVRESRIVSPQMVVVPSRAMLR